MITLLIMAVVLLAMLAVEAPLWTIIGILIMWVIIQGFGRKKR
ncbi:MAG TPA: hypothetical protein VL326_37005 [Kofleriaceae bacterium]|nr:hypothetical protein [Kofleriaceae bacterium]